MVFQRIFSEGFFDSVSVSIKLETKLLVKWLLHEKLNIDTKISIDHDHDKNCLISFRAKFNHKLVENMAYYSVDNKGLEELSYHYKIIIYEKNWKKSK